MKRYTCMNEVMLVEHPDGPLMKRSEVHALLRAMAEEVGKMEHEEGCGALFCTYRFSRGPCALSVEIHDQMTLHKFYPGACDCPRGRALALLEVK